MLHDLWRQGCVPCAGAYPPPKKKRENVRTGCGLGAGQDLVRGGAYVERVDEIGRRGTVPGLRPREVTLEASRRLDEGLQIFLYFFHEQSR